MRYVFFLATLVCFFWSGESEAACSSGADAANQAIAFQGNYILYTGNCEDDNDVLISTGDVSRYDACYLVSTVGAVDVLISLDGTTFTTAPLSLIDNGATDTNPVLVTVALRAYGFPVLFSKIKVLQNTATDATAHLFCKKYG